MLFSLFVGLVAGFLAKALMPGDRSEPSGWILTLVLGLIGGVVGGIIFGLLGIHAGGLIGHIVMSTVGAVTLIALLRYLRR
jgi:uncharacterized membrane protein YeaQ/YmgE (transglycosylase-associated protein family)